MDNKTIIPYSLRHILIYVHVDGKFPPRKNSRTDIALLRAANLAMRRKAQGMSDVFLFVFPDAMHNAIFDGLTNYGFPDAEILEVRSEIVTRQIKFFGEDDLLEDQNLQVVHEKLIKKISQSVSCWLNEKHPAAIAFSNSEYEEAGFWWIGIEHYDNVFDWPFEVTDFTAELPYVHKTKADTWLTVLGHALELHAIQATSSEIIGQQCAAAFAATLCEWLHGFDAASRNDYSSFDPSSTISSLGLSDFFLGFEAARLSNNDPDNFYDNYMDDDDPLPIALKLITADLRSQLYSALSNFFGSDGQLFWALYSAIWPKFDMPMIKLMQDCLSNVNCDNLADLEKPWYFLAERWCESAYN